MPLDETRVVVIVRAQKATGNKEVTVSYIVPAEGNPVPGLNLSQAQKDKLSARLQQMSLVLDENDTNL
jgi:hypothetical protein